MAKKTITSKKIETTSSKSAKSVSTPVRNSSIPKAAAQASKKPLDISQDQIAKRAYEIWLSGTGGSESDNWHRAERELRGV
jgi:Protein of unknown function (DUF2934)